MIRLKHKTTQPTVTSGFARFPFEIFRAYQVGCQTEGQQDKSKAFSYTNMKAGHSGASGRFDSLKDGKKIRFYN